MYKFVIVEIASIMAGTAIGFICQCPILGLWEGVIIPPFVGALFLMLRAELQSWLE